MCYCISPMCQSMDESGDFLMGLWPEEQKPSCRMAVSRSQQSSPKFQRPSFKSNQDSWLQLLMGILGISSIKAV